MLANYSKVDSTPQERDHISENASYELWLLRITMARGEFYATMARGEFYATLAGHRCRLPSPGVLVEIEIMKPGVTSIAADLAYPSDLIGDDRMEVSVQSTRPRRRKR